jgi:hypothetical protein
MKSANCVLELAAEAIHGSERRKLRRELWLVYDAAEFGQGVPFRKNEGVLRHY